MSSIEDALAITDEENDETDQEDSSVLKQVRNYAKKLERELKTANKEREELAAFRAQYEEQQKASEVKSKFQAVGLNEKHAELFLAVRKDAEANEEVIQAFAQEYGLSPTAKDEAPEEKTPFFTPTTAPAGAQSAQRLSWDQYLQMRSDPNQIHKALEARQKGLVEEPG